MELHQLLALTDPWQSATHLDELGTVSRDGSGFIGLPRYTGARPAKKGNKARALECPLNSRMINSLALMTGLPGFIYVASPYSKYPLGIELAFQHAARLTGELVKGGMSCYSPISHSHPIAMHGHIDPLDHSLWMNQCKAMMEAASGCVVLKMDGWAESVGVKMEIDYFDKANKPVLPIDPKALLGGEGLIDDELAFIARHVHGLDS